MIRILSSGTTMTVATAAGDAGQLGMAAGFLGGLTDLIRLPHATRRAATVDFTSDGFTSDDCDRGDLSLGNGFGGDRPWADLGLADRVISGFTGLARTGQRALGQFRHHFSWPSVYQH